tara:strand:+ start:784 stop:1635 length:852 start_codon:yes stop_codon:yes gene_type:complete
MIKIILAILNIFVLQYVFGLIIPSEGAYLSVVDPMTAMLIISGVTKLASTVGSLGQASRAKDDMRKAERQASKAVKKAYERAGINPQEMRTIDPTLYETAGERISQDLSTALEITAGDDPRLQAAMGSRLAQQAARERQNLELQKRRDIQALEADIATGEEARLRRLANLDLAQARGFQQQAADAQQRRVAAQQQAIGAATSIIDDYTGLIAAGVASPQQIQRGFQTTFGRGMTQTPVGDVVTPIAPAPAIRTTTGGSGIGSLVGGPGYMSQAELDYILQLPR